MTTTPQTEAQRPWWSFEHRHTRRCFWSWETGRWICPTSDRPATTTPDAHQPDPTTEEQR